MTERAEPILPSRDLNETRSFYKSIGFDAWFSGRGNPDYEIVSRGNLVVHFVLSRELKPFENESGCYWRVSDADALHKELAILNLPSSGIPRLERPENKPWGMREFALLDPSGNLIRIGQELR